jgi:hypothetical protein
MASPHRRTGPTTRVSIVLAALAILASCTREVRILGRTGEPRIEGQRAVWTGAATAAWTWSYPTGARRERGQMVAGHRGGSWSQWWSNGELRSEGQRVYDADTRTSPREGPWTFWHPSGAVAARGIFRHGRREGAWEFSLDDGRLDGDRSGLYHDDEKLAE